MTKSGRNALFTISAHSGIIYDFEFRTQTVLQGHCNFISCCAISKDKRWIVTADAGTDSLLVVWDSHSGAPVKTLFNPHSSGLCSVDISDDALFIATLSQPDEVSPCPCSKKNHTQLSIRIYHCHCDMIHNRTDPKSWPFGLGPKKKTPPS